VVDFYGIHPKVDPDVSKLSGSVLAHFGRRDKWVNEQTARALVNRIEAAGKTVEAHFYDADHAFFNDQRPEVYDRESAELAWRRTLDFLRRALA
jgi:carboxymethylenebutenolidase